MVYYIGTNQSAVLTGLRELLLGRLKPLPIEGEYLHRDYFEACRRHGRDTFALIHYLGPEMMPGFFALKRSLDANLGRLNVGHLYAAKPAQVAFYRQLDPTNAMNPGIGKTTKLKNWRLANEGDLAAPH